MAGAEADSADIQWPRLVKIRQQQQHHAGCWWHSCLGRLEGRKKNPFPDVSIDVGMKNQLFRRILPDWRLFLTRKVFHFYDKQRTDCRLPRLGVAWPVWDLIENHGAIQCDVTKGSSANTQVQRHPCGLQKRLQRDLRKRNMLSVQARTEIKCQNKDAQISARCVGSSAGHPHCVFASILIFIRTSWEQTSGCL